MLFGDGEWTAGTQSVRTRAPHLVSAHAHEGGVLIVDRLEPEGHCNHEFGMDPSHDSPL